MFAERQAKPNPTSPQGWSITLTLSAIMQHCHLHNVTAADDEPLFFPPILGLNKTKQTSERAHKDGYQTPFPHKLETKRNTEISQIK